MKTIARYIFILLTLFMSLSFPMTSWADDVEIGKRVPAYIDESGDTIPNYLLAQVYVYPVLKFTSEKQEKFYWRTVRDVKKMLPYAKQVRVLLAQIDSTMATMETEKEKKEYMKKKEDELVATYKPIFKKMTLSQGKMMIRLVDRETGQTGYVLVQQLRGKFRAFWWQAFAKMLGADLKTTYDPEDPDDRIVERVITLVEAGQL